MSNASAAIYGAVVARLLELGRIDVATVAEEARIMIAGREKFSEHSMDETGHETCRDWMDPELVRLLDQPLRAKYGLPTSLN